MKTPLLDGIRKEALFPRSIPSLLKRLTWRFSKDTKNFTPKLDKFLTGVIKEQLPKTRHMDLPGYKEKLHRINKAISRGELPSFKLPKGESVFHVTDKSGFTKLIPQGNKRNNILFREGLGSLVDKPRIFFTLGGPTNIFDTHSSSILKFPSKSLRGRGRYLDPWDSFRDLGQYIHRIKKGRAPEIAKGIDWDKLRPSMIFTGKPVAIKPENILAKGL